MNKSYIDFHTHTFPDKIAEKALASLSAASKTPPFSDGTNDGLLAKMKEAGIGLSVILPVATSPKQVEKINDTAALTNQRYAGSLHSFGCMHPLYEHWHDELARIRDLGLKGIKIHPVYQGVDIDDPLFTRILKRCRELDLIVVTHAGQDIGFPGEIRCSPEMIRHAVEETGPFRFILAHMGGWRDWQDVPKYLKDTDVFLDTSFSGGTLTPNDPSEWNEEDLEMLDPEQFTDLIRTFGSDRIVFGTDSPWGDQKASLDWFLSLPLSKEEQNRILYENASILLKQVLHL